MAPTGALEPAFYLLARSGGHHSNPTSHEIYNTTHLTAIESKDASSAKTNGSLAAALCALGGLVVCWLIFKAWRNERRSRERRTEGVKLAEGRDGVEMGDKWIVV
jgi:hypothetical protein